jgi:hypothetical protein
VRPFAGGLIVAPRAAARRAGPGMGPDRGSGIAAQRSHFIAICLVMVGIFLPPTMVIVLGNTRLFPGRIAIMILLAPAIFVLLRRPRRLLASDLFTFATACWILIASISAEGFNSIASAAIEALEFCGAYTVARGYVFGQPALVTFIRVFKLVTITLVALALLDTLSGRPLTIEVTADLFNSAKFSSPTRPLFGFEIIRAVATFDHTILYGTFCALAAAIFLYSERTLLSRLGYFCLSSFGCLLAVSSAPLITLFIVTASYLYDRLLKNVLWRWKAFWSVIAVLLVAAFLVSDHPVASIISRLTLDPSSGYYRIMIWELAMPKISISPFTGFGFQLFNDPVLDTSVDSVWLVFALRFGIPMVVLLFLTNISSFSRSVRGDGIRSADSFMSRMRTGFTLVLIMFLFTGLTVHYWNGAWMFWGLCLGIRVSLNEYFAAIKAPNVRRSVGV